MKDHSLETMLVVSVSILILSAVYVVSTDTPHDIGDVRIITVVGHDDGSWVVRLEGSNVDSRSFYYVRWRESLTPGEAFVLVKDGPIYVLRK